MCWLFRLDRLSITNPFSPFPVPLFPVLQADAAFSSLAFSAPPQAVAYPIGPTLIAV